MSLEAKFQKASVDVQGLSQKPSNQDMLELYSLFKAASVGAVQGKRPGALNMVARAKYDAWSKLGEISKEDAMNQYIAKVESMIEAQ